jgi:hypothetical protein
MIFKKDPEAIFRTSGSSLRDRLKNSNYILLKIPIEIHNLGHGERLTCMDSERLPEELGVTDQDCVSLSQKGLVHRWLQKPQAIG